MGHPTVTPETFVEHGMDVLVAQYANAPKLRKLLRGILGILRDECLVPLLAMERWTNPAEAQGVLLDWIGRRLGLGRPLVSTSTFFGMEGTPPHGGETFDHAPLWTAARAFASRAGVGDSVYSKLLLARARRLRHGADRETLEECLSLLFGTGYAELESDGSVSMNVPAEADLVLSNMLFFNDKLTHKVVPLAAGQKYIWSSTDV